MKKSTKLRNASVWIPSSLRTHGFQFRMPQWRACHIRLCSILFVMYRAWRRLRQKGGRTFTARLKPFILKTATVITVECEDNVVIRARHLVMATGYPIFDGPNLFFSKLFPKRTYGIAVKAKSSWPEGSYITAGKATRSFRTHMENGQPVLIVAGDGHTTGRGKEEMTVHFENLMQFADRLAGVDEVLAMWSAQDYESPDLLPYIGRISDHSNIYIASGYRKWGLTNGTLAGNLLAEMIASGNCQYESLYSRTRADFLSSPGTAIKKQRYVNGGAH